MLELVKVNYQGQPLSFSEDGWFNATVAAERFGKRVDHYLANSETKEYLAILCEEENTRKVGYFMKTRRGRNGGTWFHPDLAIHFARWLNVHFAVWCDRQIRKLLTGNHPHFDWKRSRHTSVGTNKALNLTIKMARERHGKTCAPHHFSNEARLINYVMSGNFGKLDRDGLCVGDLDLLAKLESLNMVLIANNMEYADRKEELARYAEEQRGPRLIVVDQAVNG